MKRAIEQLKETLIQENDTYNEALRLENEKINVIKASKVKQLDEMTKLEQQYLARMGTYEKIRRSIFVAIAEELELPEIGSLSELLMLMEDQEDVEEIDALRNQLLETIMKIKEANEANEKLIKQQLEFINFSIDILTSDPIEGMKYSGNAQEKAKIKTNLFDARV